MLSLLLLVSCRPPASDVEPSDSDSGPADIGDDAAAIDPLALAAEVSEAEVRATIEDLEDLRTRYTYTTGDEDARDYLVGRLEAYGYEAEVQAFSFDEQDPVNVVAKKAGEGGAIWIFSAHYDSTSNQPTTLAPGADDNASGVAGVLEAARILAPLRLSGEVWFVLTAAEEQGAVGADALVDDDPSAEVAGVIAPDMIGYWPLGDADAFDILGDPDSEHLARDMADVADALGVAYKLWIDHGHCYGDDHTTYQEAGWPAISPMDCVEAHNIGTSGEDTPHYHRTTDTSDTLYFPFMIRVVQVEVATLATWAVE